MTDDRAEAWLPIKEAAARYGLNYHRLYKLYQRGVIRGRRVPPGNVQIDRAALEDYLPPPGWAWVHDVVERYSLTLSQIHRMVDQGRVRSRQPGRELQVELTSLEAVLRKREIPAGFVTAEEAAQRLGISSGHVLWLIHHGRLRAQRQGRKWIVVEDSVEEHAVPPGYVTIKEAAQRSGRSPRTIRRWIQEGRVRARKAYGHQWIVEDSLPEQKEQRERRTRPEQEGQTVPPGWKPINEDNYLGLQEAADRYGLNYDQLHKLIQYKRVRRIYEGRYVLVDVASLKDWLPPPGWAWLNDAAKRYGLAYARVRELIKRGQVRSRKRGQRWQVELYGLEVALKRRQVPAGWITIQEAGRRLQVPSATVLKRIEAGLLPGRKHGWRWIVDEAAVMAQVPPAGWISVQEATRMTQMRPCTIIQWIQEEKIRGQKLGGRWFVEQASIAALAVAPEWIKVPEASVRWGVPGSKIRHWARHGRVQARKVGWTWYVAAEGLRMLTDNE